MGEWRTRGGGSGERGLGGEEMGGGDDSETVSATEEEKNLGTGFTYFTYINNTNNKIHDHN